MTIPPDGGYPRVLVSYSTDALQNSPDRLQTALDALADLPVAVLATTSGVFSVGGLRIPANATVLDYLPHAAVMTSVALAVCHAGHGTTMSALTHGVPLVCVPGLGRDQKPIARRVDELGFGIALARDASAPAIRRAVTTILADAGYRERVQKFARSSESSDGADRAAAAILATLDRAA